MAKSKSKAKPTSAKAKPSSNAKNNSSKTDDRWWDFIERSRKGADGNEEQMEKLHELLVEELSPAEIVAFDKFVQERISGAYRWDLWEIAYIMNGGCSDDGFDYFCGWLIAKGKKHYEAALANPEDAAKGVSPDDEPFEAEDMWYVASNAWEEKTGRAFEEYPHPEVERELQGEQFDEDAVYDKHPKLSKKFGGG